MTNYLQKVLLPQYSHVNKVYCLLAATVFCALPLCSTVSVPSLPVGGKTRGGFHKTAPYELHGSVSRLTLSDNAQHNSAAAML